MEAAREAELQEGSKDVYDLSRREQLHVGNLDDIMLSRDGPWRLAFCSQQYWFCHVTCLIVSQDLKMIEVKVLVNFKELEKKALQ